MGSEEILVIEFWGYIFFGCNELYKNKKRLRVEDWGLYIGDSGLRVGDWVFWIEGWGVNDWK